MDFINGFHHAALMVLKLVFSILMGLIVVAIGDFAYQKISYRNKLRMTKEQAKKEHKEQGPESCSRQKGRLTRLPVRTLRIRHVEFELLRHTSGLMSQKMPRACASRAARGSRVIARRSPYPRVYDVSHMWGPSALVCGGGSLVSSCSCHVCESLGLARTYTVRVLSEGKRLTEPDTALSL